MTEWSAEDRRRFDEAKRALESGDVNEVAKLLHRSRHCVECERLQRELDTRFTSVVHECCVKAQELQAELDRMRPVVEAAAQFELCVRDFQCPCGEHDKHCVDKLLDAVRAAKGASDE